MNQLIFITIGLVATGITIGVIAGGRRNSMSSEAGLVGGVVGLSLWAVFAISADSVEIVTNSGEIITYSYQSLAVLGVAASALCLFAVYEAALSQLNKEEY